MTTTADSSMAEHPVLLDSEDSRQTAIEAEAPHFLSAKATGVQATLPSTDQYVPKLREEPLKPSDRRMGYWSAGVINQYNGVRTPPLPAKHQKTEELDPTVI